ncbi:MAG: CoA pyrophosphatase [Gammaproteobacteria bacterium]|nr:CoA pyrophosphatase [Gammaproteobacteria bacterium]
MALRPVTGVGGGCPHRASYHAPMLDLASIRRRLDETRPAAFTTTEHTRQAAVAVVLREPLDGSKADAEVLFIQRAKRPGDPWSGHMAFPGGHLDPTDADLCAAAVRETQEEIGLDISNAPVLGQLNPQRPQAVRRDMVVAPFVFAIEGAPSFSLNYEVAEAVWTPLAPMHRGDNHTIERRPVSTGAMGFNGFRLAGGHFVWGMTYRMVQTFFATIDSDYQPVPE